MTQKMNDDVDWRAALNALGTVTVNEARAFSEDLATFDADRLAEAKEFVAVANLLAFGAPEIEPSAGVWDKLCAVMETEPKSPAANAPAKETAPHQIAQLDSSALLTIRRDEGDYQQVSEGIFAKVLFENQRAGTTTYLVKFMPGAKTPLHRHTGLEECTVVEGDFQVDGKDLRAGDYHCAMPGSVHERPYSINGATVLIVAEGHYEVLAN
ncbi:MAG: cupin domain-containing protein [Acidobacteria bacterium]|nr:cupin domain-containing protein [Acidobacteriota bacterium]